MTRTRQRVMPAWMAVALMIGIGAGAGQAQAQNEFEPDYSTPQASAMTFVQALEEGNAEAAKAAAIATEGEEQMIEAMASMVSGFKKLHDAATERFGEDEAETLRQAVGGDDADMRQTVERARVHEEGDRARLRDPDDPLDEGLQLRRVDGDWKVDLTAMMAQDEVVEADIEQMVPMFQAMGQAAGDVADEVAQGQYNSVEEASQAMQTRMMMIIMQGMQMEEPREMPEPPQQDEPAPAPPPQPEQ